MLVGGTFDVIHAGHRKLLDTAMGAPCELFIGLVSDGMLRTWKPEVKRSFDERKKQLEEYLVGRGHENWTIVGIDDPYEDAVKGDFDVLVVSWETSKRADEINLMRSDIGKKALKIKVVEPVMASDLLPISSSRIRSGDIDADGNRLTPVRICTRTNNDLKLDVIKEVMDDIFQEVRIQHEPLSNGKEQPYGTELIDAAVKRAQVPEGYDYGVGIESGVIEYDHGLFSVECAVVKDLLGKETFGKGPEFPIPQGWKEDLKGGITLSQKIHITFKENVNAVDVLTGGRIKRKDCIKAVLLMAMIPRLMGKLYGRTEIPTKNLL